MIRNEQQLWRRLKLRDLNVLATVVRSGSMGKAAAQLSVSQPAVSKAIADMEYALGVRLLDRSPQGVEPTIYGRALLDRGLIAFDELRQGVKHIEFLADPTAGEVSIGSSVIMGESFVGAVIDRLARRRPQIVMHLVAAETSLIYRALEERKIDLAIVGIFKPIAEAHVNAEVIFRERYVVAAGAQNPWAHKRKIAIVELMNEPWALPPSDSMTGSVVAEMFRACGLDVPRASLVTASTPARRALLTRGRYLSILPASVLRFSGTKGEIKALPVDMPAAQRPIGILTLKNRTLNPVAQSVIDCAREVAKISG